MPFKPVTPTKPSMAGILFAAFLILFLSHAFASLHAADWCRVEYVVDGDTIRLEDGRTVRYLGINAPEIKHKETPAEPFGDDARDENQALVGKKKVRLEFDQELKDQYGRTLAYVYLENGQMVNRLLVEKGFAWALVHKPNTRYEKTFSEAQEKAIAGEKGVWQVWKRLNGAFIGNKNSRRFHEKGCPYEKKIGKKNRVTFNTSLDAFRRGFSPCKHCIDL